jgi:serine/threonine protein phosphatase PrpC
VFDEDRGDDFEALAGFLHHIGPRSPDEIADACVEFANRRQRTDDAAVIVVTLAR